MGRNMCEMQDNEFEELCQEVEERERHDSFKSFPDVVAALAPKDA